jgi:hypothetical protein
VTSKYICSLLLWFKRNPVKEQALSLVPGKVKGEVHPITGHEGPEWGVEV